MRMAQRLLDGVRRKPCPTDKRPRWHRLFAVPAGGRAGAVVLSDCVAGYDCHWIVSSPQAGYLTLCPGPDLCPCCQVGWPATWYGYLACQELPSGKAKLLAVPQASYAHCPGLREHDGHLRGRELWFQREGDTRCGALTARLVAGDPSRVLPAAWDVEEEVLRRFGTMPISCYLPAEGGAR